MRLDRLRHLMEIRQTDLVVLAPGAHLQWLFGFAPHPDERACLLLIGREKAGWVMPALNADDVRQHSDLPFWEWVDATGPQQALIQALGEIAPKVQNLSLDETMRADHALLVLDALPQAKRSFAAQTIGELRMRKDPQELALLEENARIADLAQKALHQALRAGMTEKALAEAAKAAFVAEGAKPAFAIIGAGENSAFPHHHTGSSLIREGQPIVCDIGASKGGYYSDITRMICLGTPPLGYEEVHAVVEAAVQAAIAIARPGIPAKAVDDAARSVITAAGYGAYFTHRTGHGLGTEVHEAPYMTATSETLLEEGMVFTIEPGIYLPGRFGIRLEEVAVITKDGCRILSTLSRDLAIIQPA